MFSAPLMPTTLRDRKGRVWLYQFGRMYADDRGTLRHMDGIRR